jgi:hypothetical protein
MFLVFGFRGRSLSELLFKSTPITPRALSGTPQSKTDAGTAIPDVPE